MIPLNEGSSCHLFLSQSGDLSQNKHLIFPFLGTESRQLPQKFAIFTHISNVNNRLKGAARRADNPDRFLVFFQQIFYFCFHERISQRVR